MPQQYRILIAEDEPRISAFMERGLRRHGYETTVVDRGDRAVDLALNDHFDLMLLDIGLPFKDGWAVLDELREHSSPLAIIVVTARESAGDRIRLSNPTHYEQVIHCITKPFRFSALLRQVNAYLDHSSPS